MKDHLKKTLWMIFILTFALGACGASEEDIAKAQEESVAQVYTAVAQTMEAQPTTPLPTATLYVAPATITPFPTQVVNTEVQILPSPTLVPVVQQSVCKEALYISDVTISDGTVFSAGESFEKTWLILNGGTCDWEATYILAFVSGDEMSGVPIALGEIIAENGQAQVSVTFSAPLTAGTYTSYWQMTDGLGTSFGNTIFVAITVSDDATATVTATATPEYTATPTNIPTETNTPTATSTP